MGKIHRIRVRGKQRSRPDAALVAQAIIQLGRELREQDQQAQAEKKPAPTRQPEEPTDHDEVSA